MNTIGQLLIMISTITGAAILGGNLFDVIVSEKNLVKGFPQSIETVRKHYQYRNPGHFFRVLSPIFIVASVVSLIWFRKQDVVRNLLTVSLLSYGIVQAITVVYFFPQNKLLREGPVEEVQHLYKQFATRRTGMDTLRNLLTLISCFLNLFALLHTTS